MVFVLVGCRTYVEQHSRVLSPKFDDFQFFLRTKLCGFGPQNFCKFSSIGLNGMKRYNAD